MTSHVVVDGSNLATEGRKLPNLGQLVDAVEQFQADRPHKLTTVVCDASFPNRIEDSERKRYEQLIDDGWLITPPAGAVGRGDAFILQVAAKAGATVLSNDSFQEFHGDHPWLFEDGRLVGGKPVTGVGWVFVDRTPVRGPTSRRAVRESKAPEPAREPRAETTRATTAAAVADTKQGEPKRRTRKATATPAGDESPVQDSDFSNRRAAFREFVKAHPVGSVIEGSVDAYSSHGAYANVDGIWCYVPTKSLGDPPPRRLRDVLEEGSTHSFLVAEFDRQKFGVDLTPAAPLVPSRPTRRRRSAATESPTTEVSDVATRTSKRAPAKRNPAPKKQSEKKPAEKKPVQKKPAEKKSVQKKPAQKKPARKRAAKKAVSKRSVGRKAAAKPGASDQPRAGQDPVPRAAKRTRKAVSNTGDDDGAAIRRKRTGSRR